MKVEQLSKANIDEAVSLIRSQRKIETAQKIQSKETEERIMEQLGVGIWTVRCQRVRKYFMENPDEFDFFSEYLINSTTDSQWLWRHPENRKDMERIGVNIGASGGYGGQFSSIFLYRVISTGPWKDFEKPENLPPRIQWLLIFLNAYSYPDGKRRVQDLFIPSILGTSTWRLSPNFILEVVFPGGRYVWGVRRKQKTAEEILEEMTWPKGEPNLWVIDWEAGEEE